MLFLLPLPNHPSSLVIGPEMTSLVIWPSLLTPPPRNISPQHLPATIASLHPALYIFNTSKSCCQVCVGTRSPLQTLWQWRPALPFFFFILSYKIRSPDTNCFVFKCTRCLPSSLSFLRPSVPAHYHWPAASSHLWLLQCFIPSSVML